VWGFLLFDVAISVKNPCGEFVFAIKHQILIKMSAIVITTINAFEPHSHKKQDFHETAFTDCQRCLAQRTAGRLPQQQQ
jgi:hypothetical protein